MKRLALALLVFSMVARAEAQSVAVTSLGESGLSAGDAARLERMIDESLRGPLALRPVAAAAKTGAKDRRAPNVTSVEARFATDPVARALALGGELHTDLALAVDAALLGDGMVLYLQGVDVARGQAIASTAVSLRSSDPDRGALASALVRALLPDRYRGTLDVRVDVPGAQILVDGAPSPAGARSLSCGTHSLRVTHPAYRDFLRFVSIDYGKPTVVDVALSHYPVDEGELRSRNVVHRTVVVERWPWYRRWWVITIASAVLFGASVTAAALVARDVAQSDQRVTCCTK